MSPLDFGDLPEQSPTARVSRAWMDEAAQLRDRPGEWALLMTKDTPSKASDLAGNIRRGIMKAFQPAGAFEATIRGRDVWVRYVGGAA